MCQAAAQLEEGQCFGRVRLGQRMACPSRKICKPEESGCHRLALRVVIFSQAKPVLGTLDHSGGLSHLFDPSANINTGYNGEPDNPIPGVNPKWGDRSSSGVGSVCITHERFEKDKAKAEELYY